MNSSLFESRTAIDHADTVVREALNDGNIDHVGGELNDIMRRLREEMADPILGHLYKSDKFVWHFAKAYQAMRTGVLPSATFVDSQQKAMAAFDAKATATRPVTAVAPAMTQGTDPPAQASTSGAVRPKKTQMYVDVPSAKVAGRKVKETGTVGHPDKVSEKAPADQLPQKGREEKEPSGSNSARPKGAATASSAKPISSTTAPERASLNATVYARSRQPEAASKQASTGAITEAEQEGPREKGEKKKKKKKKARTEATDMPMQDAASQAAVTDNEGQKTKKRKRTDGDNDKAAKRHRANDEADAHGKPAKARSRDETEGKNATRKHRELKEGEEARPEKSHREKAEGSKPDKVGGDAPKKKASAEKEVKFLRQRAVPKPSGQVNDPPCIRCAKNKFQCQVQVSTAAKSCVKCGKNRTRCEFSTVPRHTSGHRTDVEADDEGSSGGDDDDEYRPAGEAAEGTDTEGHRPFTALENATDGESTDATPAKAAIRSALKVRKAPTPPPTTDDPDGADDNEVDAMDEDNDTTDAAPRYSTHEKGKGKDVVTEDSTDGTFISEFKKMACRVTEAEKTALHANEMATLAKEAAEEREMMVDELHHDVYVNTSAINSGAKQTALLNVQMASVKRQLLAVIGENESLATTVEDLETRVAAMDKQIKSLLKYIAKGRRRAAAAIVPDAPHGEPHHAAHEVHCQPDASIEGVPAQPADKPSGHPPATTTSSALLPTIETEKVGRKQASPQDQNTAVDGQVPPQDIVMHEETECSPVAVNTIVTPQVNMIPPTPLNSQEVATYATTTLVDGNTPAEPDVAASDLPTPLAPQPVPSVPASTDSRANPTDHQRTAERDISHYRPLSHWTPPLPPFAHASDTPSAGIDPRSPPSVQQQGTSPHELHMPIPRQVTESASVFGAPLPSSTDIDMAPPPASSSSLTPPAPLPIRRRSPRLATPQPDGLRPSGRSPRP